jgi:hypothetical protein
VAARASGVDGHLDCIAGRCRRRTGVQGLVFDLAPPELAGAAAAIEQVEQEIDHLWFDSMTAEDLAMSQRLADVSHALQRAARLLEPDNAIG